MSKIRVGVVRGGPSSEYGISLKTGSEVLKHLPEAYEGFDVLLSKDGEWHLNGFPKKPHKLFSEFEVVFNALHGEYGEDGRIQQVFELFNMPYTGSRIVPSALAMKKHLAREIFKRENIKIPRGLVLKDDSFLGVEGGEYAKDVFNTMMPPWVIKPASLGSSVGISIAGSFDELAFAIEKAFSCDDIVLAEEYIKGREATCGVLEDWRGEEAYALPPVEIIPAFAEASAGKPPSFFDYEAKYDGSTREICPAGFDMETKREIEKLAKRAHRALGCSHYSRSDFIVSPRGVYLLEVNTLPGLTSESLFPKAARAAGLEFPALLDHIIKLALRRE